MNDRHKKTHEAMLDPRVGDRYHEMYNHWMYVVKVSYFFVWTISMSSPCIFPQDGVIEKWTRWGFRKHFSYKIRSLSNRYWMTLADRGNDVEGWI